MAITILDLARFRGVKPSADGSISCGDIADVGLPFWGGCQSCHATIAAYNACPSTSGFLRCASGCIDEDGYETVEEANRDLFPEEYEWKGVRKPTTTDEDEDSTPESE